MKDEYVDYTRLLEENYREDEEIWAMIEEMRREAHTDKELWETLKYLNY